MHWHRSSVPILARALPVSRKGRSGLRGGPTVTAPDGKRDCSVLTTFSIKILHLSELPKSSHWKGQLLIGFRGPDAQVHLKLN